MKSRLFKPFMLLFCLIVLLSATPALADTGPKPTMEFNFKPEVAGSALQITAGTMYECQQADCSDAIPLEELGPQGFRCQDLGCRALAYGFAPYHKIEVVFSDGITRPSNIFQTSGFDSKYTVTIHPADLLVEDQLSLAGLPPFVTIALGCLCLVLLIGLGVAGLVYYRRRAAAVVAAP